MLILTRLYVFIAALRVSQLWRMYSLSTLMSNMATADCIHKIILSDDEQDKIFAQYLTEPDHATAQLFAVFNRSEYPEIEEFVHSKGLTFQNLNADVSDSPFLIRPLMFKDYWIIMSSNVWGTIRGTKSPSLYQNVFFFSLQIRK